MSDPEDPARQEIRAYIESAHRMLQVADLNLSEGFHESAVNRAYYAIFYAANGLLATRRGVHRARTRQDRHTGCPAFRSMNRALSSGGGLPVKQCLRPNEQNAVTEFLSLLQRDHATRVLQTVLFGSKARGDSGQWSDIDILIIVDQEDWRLSHAISNLAADVSLDYDVLIGPRVIGRERWERMKETRSGLYRNVVAEGMPPTPVPASF